MKPFTFDTTASITFGAGISGRLGQIIGKQLGERILFITDPGIRKLGLEQQALLSLKMFGLTTICFDEVESDPSLATIEKAAAMAIEMGISGVIGFGGGSSLDVSKLVALLAGSREEVEGIWGVDNAKGPRLPLVLVPTTAGTGSEATPIAIATVTGQEKRGVSSRLILPDIAVLDPVLTLGLPQNITAATGVDSMIHAIEAYISTNPNNNPISEQFSLSALKLIGANIDRAYEHGNDQIARANMLLGSMQAGQAFANSPVGGVHALAYPVGSIFHVPHGVSTALLLTAVLDFYRSSCKSRLADLAKETFPTAVTGKKDEDELARAFIQEIDALCRRVGLPRRLRDVGVGASDLQTLANEAMKQTRLLGNGPRPIGLPDALAIFEAAW